MAKQIANAFTMVNTFSNNTVNSLQNSLNIFTDVIINGIKLKKKDSGNYHYKYYKYINIVLILLIFGLLYYLNSYLNLFGVKNTQYEILGTLVLFTFASFYFLFLVFRNNKNNIIEEKDRLTTSEALQEALQDKHLSSGEYTKDFNIDSQAVKNTYLKPLGIMFMYLSILFFILISVGFLLNYILYSQKNSNAFSITQSIIVIIISIVVLAIFAVFFSIKPTTNENACESEKEGVIIYNYLCIIKRVIFFIPCLLILLVDEINEDIKLTPSSIYLLLFMLLLLITLLFLLPFLFNYFETLNKSKLLKGNDPYYLNELRVIGIYQNLNKNVNSIIDIPIPKIEASSSLIKNPIDAILNKLDMNKNENTIFKTLDLTQIDKESKDVTKQTKDNISDTKGYTFKLLKNDYNGIYNMKTSFFDPPTSVNKFPYNYSYSISFYIYINPQPENTSYAYTKDTEIFNYAYKPVIYYNGKSQSIIVRSRTLNNKGDQLDTIYEGKNIKHQKWVFFVINYENNIIDVFIDGKLVGSKKDVTPYFKGDKVTIGEKDGINGSIKEIFYYDTIKTPQTVELLYNLTNNK
uniref:Uncharacterized protein n=1 Tax=viral metagenome TaxID=1070528 RepID=A0A6C0DY87_9ZZZZ